MSGATFQKAFRELTPKEIDFLSLNTRKESYGDGEIILEKGQNPQEIFVVTKGQVRVVRKKSDGSLVDLTSPIGVGESLGEMSFVDNLGASADLVAAGDVTLEVIDQNLVDEAIELDPTFSERLYHSLLVTLINRLRHINDVVTT